MADPQLIVCEQACTITVQHEIVTPLLSLTSGEGAAISSAVLLVWVVGWAVRMLIRMLRDTDGYQPTSE